MYPDDDDWFHPLPELDGSDDEEAGADEDGLELVGESETEEIGLDDATGADDPIDSSLLAELPEDALGQGAEDEPLPGLDAGLDLEDGDGASWVEPGGREVPFDAGEEDLDEAPLGAAEDGGALGLEDLLPGDEGEGDEVDLPPLGPAEVDSGTGIGTH